MALGDYEEIHNIVKSGQPKKVLFAWRSIKKKTMWPIWILWGIKGQCLTTTKSFRPDLLAQICAASLFWLLRRLSRYYPPGMEEVYMSINRKDVQYWRQIIYIVRNLVPGLCGERETLLSYHTAWVRRLHCTLLHCRWLLRLFKSTTYPQLTASGVTTQKCNNSFHCVLTVVTATLIYGCGCP